MADLPATVAASVRDLVAVNDALYSTISRLDSGDDLRERVDQWHSQALLWISLGNGIADGSNPRSAEWITLGKKLAATATEIGQAASDSTPGALATAFIKRLPASFGTVIKAVASPVGEALSFSAGLIPWWIWASVGTLAVGAVVFVAWRASSALAMGSK